MPHVRARLAGASAHLPERYVTMAQREAQIAAAGPFAPPSGLVTQLTGVQGVHLIGDDEQASDLAVAAARKLLAEHGTDPTDIDLMIFASASQDLAEPATCHIVAAGLGLTCPVFDLKNACNSVLNAIETANALIATGQYRTVLITCGEAPSLFAPPYLPDAQAFVRAMPSLGLSDAGCAILLTAHEADHEDPLLATGVIASRFAADSTAWPSVTVSTGGTIDARRPAGAPQAWFQMTNTRMRDSLTQLTPRKVLPLIGDLGLTFEDFAFIGVHQVSLADIEFICGPAIGVPRDRLVVIVDALGNLASASVPLQLARALESGQAGPGDLIGLVGLAAGCSAGMVIIRL
ncbi:3-oxoacyl-ACP synthase III family protein [Kitasatospora viridis]|uniref:3-oxoacyl-[acyl-carrier-protein] synthase-3 n=1 Tax=Kitasatospora viridis TaxID=281105 RepID=A0A561TW24_9ACTN|nr:3-oxoacyl-[acyl-carrier-protein] synthase III C-terminal domain-containing protein [Kitasatospora viridis]TWF91309.1 3-oxoacyl-[acyl-carrier-protein] synthase-3 [Kitasatospora viridis]